MKLQPRRLPFDYDPSRDSEFADGTDYWDDTTEQSDYTATITDLSVIDTTDTHRKKLFNNNNRTNDSETSPVWSKGHFLALLKVERLYRRYQGSYKWYRIVSELNKFYTIVTEKEAEEVFNSYMACMLRTPIDVLRNGDQYSQTIDHVRTDSLRRRKGRKKAIRVSDG